MGIKRPKKGSEFNLKSSDKKARYEAGLDLTPGGSGYLEVEESMLAEIVKEVTSPKPIQAQIDEFLSDFFKFVKKIEFPKKSIKNLEHFPWYKFEEKFKFSGGSIASCNPLGALKSKTLVFPNAVGEVCALFKCNQNPETETQMKETNMFLISQIFSSLKNCSLIKPDNIKFSKKIFSEDISLELTPAAKFGKHFKLVLSVKTGDSIREPQMTVNDGDKCVSSEPYQAAAVALEVWRRQSGVSLSSAVIPCLLLHSQLVGTTNISMKPWQIVKKLWGMISNLDLEDKQIIIGVPEPVPHSEPSSIEDSPLLAKDGQTPVCQGLTWSQWLALSQFASKSLGQGVEMSLLKNVRHDAVCDRLYKIIGDTNVKSLIKNISRGLEKRVTMLVILGGSRSWNYKDQEEKISLDVGVRFDPDLHNSASTLGPLANCETAADFRQFWGDRSELRRFQDGVVREVVVWGGDNIVTDVVTAVIARHHKGCSIEEVGFRAEALIPGDGGRGARKVLDKLTPLLYNLEEIPLKISSVSAIGQHGRSSCVQENEVLDVGGKVVKEEHGVAKLTSKTGMAPKYNEPLDVHLNTELSGKWPKDPEARRRVQLAWLIELGKCLSKQSLGCVTKVMGESLIVMMDSQVLRLRVGTRNDEAQISSWLSSIDKSFPAWSGCVRLAQRWVSSHLLSSIPDLAIEVSVAVVLSAALMVPTCASSALILWIHTMATQDWNSSPLCHPSCRDTNLDRSALPPMAVLCPYSPSPSHWTRGVTWPELQRLVHLASTCLTSQTIKCADLFKPNLECYEALIHLKPLQVPNRHLAVNYLLEKENKTVIKTSDNRNKTIPIIGHNSVIKFVNILNSCYGNLAKFYYDKYGGSVIGVKIFSKKEDGKFKLAEFQGKMISDGCVVPNWGAVIEDWSILGDGLVKNVEVINTDLLL